MQTGTSVAERVLSLLRQWGWEAGLEKLKGEISTTPDPDQCATLRLFAGWLAGERGDHIEALEQLKASEHLPELTAWSEVGQAYIALRKHDYAHGHKLLDLASKNGDPMLGATTLHCRGAIFFHEGKLDAALPLLNKALELFGKEHFGAGRVLNTLGMVYAGKDNFHAAREFFERGLECQRRFDDDAGIALAHGQLGRLYLQWGNLNKAEEHFKQDLELARRIDDERGEAQMYNHLGQISLERCKWEEATAWLEESIRLSHQGGWTVLEGYARKDRALAHLGLGEIAEAEMEVEKAQALFAEINFAEGIAHVNRIRAIVWREQKNYDESERALRRALKYFDDHNERAEGALTQLEKAYILRARGVPRPLITDALSNALERAERCRRDMLVRKIEAEMREVDETAYYRHIYERSRGRNVPMETVSLLIGERETATILFLDVQGSTEYARSQDPEVIMMTLNQMMAEFETVLERHSATVTAYLGDGFMAILRGSEHARRAVLASLELVSALREFNQPREILGLKPLNVRVGIATGEVFIGNVGTYHKMDFTAIGTTCNLASRLQSEAEPGIPCINRATYEQVQDLFTFKETEPRTVNLKGLGEQKAWDVVGRPGD
jgi:class 3 adenylate cyclase/Flp pilus assembly protein TadD